MPGAGPLLLPTQAATKQVSKTTAPQQVDTDRADRMPFSQTLAKRLSDVAQNNAAGKGPAVSAPEAETTAAGGALPPNGDVLPPLPSNDPLTLVNRGLADPETGTPVVAGSPPPVTDAVPVVLPFAAAMPPRPETAPAANAAVGVAAADGQYATGAAPGVTSPVDGVLAPGERATQQSVRNAGRQVVGVAEPVTMPATSAAVTHDPRSQRAEAPLVMQLSVPLQDPGWDQAVAQRVLWMVKQGAQSAELRINPPGLGAVEIRVALRENDQARVSFTSPHADVREALEAAFPRLREMLHANGLSLEDADVSSHSFAEQRQASHYQGGAQFGSATGDAEQPGTDTATEAVVKLPIGLLDLYA